MSKYKVGKIDQKKVWEEFVLSSNSRSFLHSWNWGETNKLVGKEIIRLGFFKSKKLIGVCLLVKEKARRGPHFLIPGGPLIDWEDEGLVSTFIDKIKELGKKEAVWFIRVRPELFDTQDNRDIFRKLGFIPAPMHLHAENTWVLDITPSEEEILAGMRKNTRYSVKKSLNAGLKILESSKVDKIAILTKLQKETVKRHKFVGFSEKLFKAQIKTFGKDDQAKLYVCKKGKLNLVAAIIIFYGKCAFYHHSGSSKKARELPASYFLQWQIIREAKKRGFKYYNFWGIAPTDSPKHRFAGVTTFKKGFGGRQIDWLHAHDLPISSLYFATYTFEKIRKIVRRL